MGVATSNPYEAFNAIHLKLNFSQQYPMGSQNVLCILAPPPPKHVNTNILLLASSHREAASHSKGRESPLGAEREREFPTTKIGGGAELFLFLHFFS